MTGRRLDAEERALWARVIATVRAIEPASPNKPPISAPAPGAKAAPTRVAKAKPSAIASPKPAIPARAIGETLDGSWDRKLGRGAIAPDFAVDLHGHTLDSAHALLNASLNRAISSGARVVLLITGKPPRADPHGGRSSRGAIRGAVRDWLAVSPHALQIAAIRNAHPRHGGNGALYIILKRARLGS